MSKKVFVIIVCYNARKWIEQCLKSVKTFSTIIVDNGSSDGTVDLISSKFPHIELIKGKTNLGFGKANNIGISKALSAGADYVFLLNQDVYLFENCIDILVDIQQKNNKYGILSPIHLNGQGNQLDENFSYYLGFSANSSFYSDFILNKTLLDVYTVPFVNAAGWLVSKDCLETIGGFDPIFFHYGEDDNYCQRMDYHNFKIGVVPQTFLKHDREDRERNFMKEEDYFKNYERAIKLKYADINFEEIGEISELIKKRKSMAIKSFLKLRLTSGKFYYREAALLKRILPDIISSRRLNKVKGSHYLKI